MFLVVNYYQKLPDDVSFKNFKSRVVKEYCNKIEFSETLFALNLIFYH